MIKKLYKKIDNSNYLQSDSSINKSLLITVGVISCIILFIFLFSFFTTDLTSEYENMDKIMQNNKTEITHYLSFGKNGTINDVEEGYNVSFDNDSVSIFSKKSPYIVYENFIKPKIQYSVERIDKEIHISKTYKVVTISSMFWCIFGYVLLALVFGCALSIVFLFIWAFIYFCIIGTIVEKLYMRQLEKEN